MRPVKNTLCIVATLLFPLLAQAANGPEDEAVGIEVTTGITVVYQIKTDEWKEGVGSGLHYVEKLLNAYESMGLDVSDVRVSAVFHGDAGYWLLRDQAYQNETGKKQANPNHAIVKRLIDRGASIELCAQTMKNNGWKTADIIDGVTIVIGAYPRIIDLQLRGYTYIRF